MWINSQLIANSALSRHVTKGQSGASANLPQQDPTWLPPELETQIQPYLCIIGAQTLCFISSCTAAQTDSQVNSFLV